MPSRESYTKRLQAGLLLGPGKNNILGHVDTSTPLDEFFLTMIFAIGQLERRQTNERTKEGTSRFKKANGLLGSEEEPVQGHQRSASQGMSEDHVIVGNSKTPEGSEEHVKGLSKKIG
jgi:DNA invertase Pin-like site-specific DNA recombinase